MDAPTLTSERLTLRAMTRENVPRVAELRAQPEVARWWPAREDEYLAKKLDEPDLACWVVELGAEVVGFVQAYEDTSSEYRHAGIDLFLDPAIHGRGLGQEVVRRVARHLLEDGGHHRVITDPAAANARSLRCFEAVGFRRVGILRSYWWDHVEQRWVDGVLLDLLRDDLS
jgi:aminoglycoside 6'-N-acetyltransferase